MKLPLLIVSLTFLCFVTANCQNTAIKRPKVGVVLSGGGAKGLAHIGVLKVLEEAGIPIDYIGGTSMGSIVGGLYALGYSTHDLDSIVHAVDWDELLTDHIARQNQSMVEKDEDVKYLVSFPIKGTKISLPSGIVAGQNISALLDQLCSPAYSITNFSKFPVPFLCVATNIETGQPVILKSGNLAQAMRASMAIPTIFTPEEINGQLLLDGGLIDNFPVKAVKDMGADIIIGIDVGFKYYSKDQLKSIVRIIEQSIFMHSREKNQESRKMCDVLIVPDFGEFNSSSFSSPDSLIAIGERAAREKISQIDSVAQLFKSFKIENTRQSLAEKANSKFNIQKIEIRGLNKIPQNFLVNKLTFGVPSKVTTNDIDKYIDILYGTRFFERITYQFEPMDGGVKLVFDVIEKNANYFRVGLHYDSDFKTTLMLNTTFRNLFYRGSKITLNLALGDNPSFTGIFYKNTGWRPSNSYFSRSKLLPDYGLKIQTRRLEVYGYENDKRIASFNFGGYSSDFFLQANISNKRAVGLGFGIDYTTISDRINYGIPVDTENLFMNVYFYTQKDSYDESFFPHKGSKIQGEVKYYKGASKSVKNTDFFLGTLRMDRYIALGRKISLAPGIYIGTTYGSGIPYQYHFYLGGLGGNYLRGLVPFTGLQFMQRSNLHTWVGQFNIQWEIFKDNYVILKSNIGKTTADRKNLLVWNDILAGAGISYGYRSPIGPMELSFMLSNKNTDISTFINIGYWF